MNYKYFFFLVIGLLIFCPSFIFAVDMKKDAERVRISLNGIWEYGETPGSLRWQSVRVPSEGVPGTSRPKSACFKKEFLVPKEWQGRIIKLKFEGLANYGEISLNGKKLGVCDDPASDYMMDITREAKIGEKNEISVYLEDGSRLIKGLTKSKRFPLLDRLCYNICYAADRCLGIYKDVWLISYPEVYTDRVLITTSYRKREISAGVLVKNEGKQPVKVKLLNTILENNGKALDLPQKELTIKPNGEEIIEISSLWAKPKLWGIGGEYGDPKNLYFLKTTLLVNGKETDCKYSRFGFRELWIEGCDFYLNGKKIYLQSESTYSGWQNREYIARYFRILRSANYNMLRVHGTAGVFADEVCLDVADEMGMLLMPELRSTNVYSMDEDLIPWNETYKSQFRNRIYKCWNHPSVVMWSSDNEGATQCWNTSLEDIERLVEIYKWVKEVDPTRVAVSDGNYLLRNDERLETVSFHYPARDWIKDWQSKYKRPLMIGEYQDLTGASALLAYNHTEKYTEEDLGKIAVAYERIAKFWIDETEFYKENDIPYLSPFGFFIYGMQKRFGPTVWDLPPNDKEASRKTNVELKWPAISGIGRKPENMQISFANPESLLNWFDPSRPESSVNSIVYNALKQAFRPMPPTNENLSPEVIIRVTEKGGNQPVPEAYVMARPMEGQPQEETGILSDKEGKAWFRLTAEGKYEISCFGKKGRKTIELKNRLLPKEPGYNIPELNLEIEPD